MTTQQHNRNMMKSFLSNIIMTPSQRSISTIQNAMDSGACSVELGMSQIAIIESLEN